MELEWWRQRVVYQIYPRSFCDSNGDGLGDIGGILSRLDYLKDLGVGVLWLSPLYPSPDVDNGYDISDYCDIHPQFGTLEQMDELIAEAHRRDIKIIMDLVINHTSDQHEWFQKSRQRIEPYTDFYIWRKGEKGRKLNNWGSFFGGDVWTFDELRGEYYLHLFAREQPDLNYHNEAVIEAVQDVMRFWLERGVDGFRCDVINILYKESLENGRWRPALTGCEHYLSTPGLHRLLQRFHTEVFSCYDCFTVGETVFVTPKKAADLTLPERGELNAVFAFDHMETDCFGVKWFLRRFSPRRFLRTLSRWQKELDWNANYFENHDQPRSIPRFGDEKRYRKESGKALALLLLSLRGTPFIYQGQEIGMSNFDFCSIEEVKDVESLNIWKLTKKLHFPKAWRWKMIRLKSRDNARTPMQWDASAEAGFTSGTPWLKVNGQYPKVNVAAEEEEQDSILHFYKAFLRFRQTSDTLQTGSYRELFQKGPVLAFAREKDGEQLLAVLNLSAKEVHCPHFSGELLFHSYYPGSLQQGRLRPYEAALMRTSNDEENLPSSGPEVDITAPMTGKDRGRASHFTNKVKAETRAPLARTARQEEECHD